MSPIEQEHRQLLASLADEGVRLLPKAGSWHQRAIHLLLTIVTLGGQRRYLQDYVTTIGRTIYLPPDWETRPTADRLATLHHERVHVRQFQRYGLVPMAVAYLLLPLPLGLAWCRMRLEREAYEESVRVTHRLAGRAAAERMRPHVIRQFTSGSYGWMWPFPRALARWYDTLLGRLG
jgi:hypothetical protein